MADHTFLFVLLVVFLRMDAMSCQPAVEEPVCTSRYGFESSLLKDMLKLDFDMSILKQRYSEDIETLKTETTLAMEKLDQVTRELRDMYKNLELKSDTTLEEIRAEAVKPPVAFLVKTLSDLNSGKGKMLKFTESVFNTNGVYDHASGYFTAPVNGTYAFSVQLCHRSGQIVHIQMFADDIMISSAMLFDADNFEPCSTINSVAILVEGSRVVFVQNLVQNTAVEQSCTNQRQTDGLCSWEP